VAGQSECVYEYDWVFYVWDVERRRGIRVWVLGKTWGYSVILCIYLGEG
jgi:hypothetical protein